MMPAVVAARKAVDGRMNLPIFSVEFAWAGFAPALQDDLDRFQHHVVAGRAVDAEHDLVADRGAASEAEIDPAARHVVELCKLRGHGQRVVLVEHADAGAEPDAAGLTD